MEKKGVIRKVDVPTDWVNSIAIVEKPGTGKLRICLDPRHLNQAIKREHYQLPTVEEIATRVSGAKVFSKLDARHGYWQIPLDESSQLLTTFNTPFGRWCFTRMPLGIKSAQEVFQKRISQQFDELEGVATDIDDILIWGCSEQEHDQRLEAAVQRCKKINLTLNEEKCEFNVGEVCYCGHYFTKDGVKPDVSKIRAIQEMPAPSTKKDVERLLGTVNYLAKFVPNLSSVTAPIRELLRKDTEFQWSHEQDKAFKEIKEILTRQPGPVLKFFDVTKPITVSCDASKNGLGAVLLQDEQPIAYASRSMTEAETKYAQIEKELLAVLFALERFNQYTYGKKVLVENDHKPLEIILKKCLHDAPPRLQRMLLRLQKYDFVFKHKPGKELVVADTLSRAPLPDQDPDMEKEIACFVHTLIVNLPVTDQMMTKLKAATQEDEMLQQLKSMVLNGWPETKQETPTKIREYWHCREEISEVDGLLLKNEKIIIPQSLHPEMLNKIHNGHMGTEKCKRRAQDVLYWPGMNSQIDEMVLKCLICLEYCPSNQKEPMIPQPISTSPWETVTTDLFLWNNSNYLLVVDYFSRYFETAKLPDTKSNTVIHYTKSIFARHGIPREVKSDNGPQYSSYLSILEYWNTRIDNIASPAQMLMSRRLRSTIPTTKSQLQPRIIDETLANSKIKSKQISQKYYFDSCSKELPTVYQGEKVRVRQGDKWNPAVITGLAETPRSFYVKTPNRNSYRRNRKHILNTEEEQSDLAEFDDFDVKVENHEDRPMPVVQPAELTTSFNHQSTFVAQPPESERPATRITESQVQSPLKTRSGRVIKKPIRFKDYIS